MVSTAPYSARFCSHYRNSYSECRAGVDVAAVTDEDGRMPCAIIRNLTGKLLCDRIALSPLPPEESPGSMAMMLAAITSGRCPKCSGSVAGEMEFNGAILAMPCRHVIRSAKE